jgi:hypothetical protein
MYKGKRGSAAYVATEKRKAKPYSMRVVRKERVKQKMPDASQ